MEEPTSDSLAKMGDNVDMDLKEIGYESVEWVNLAQDRDQCRDFANMLNLYIP
jgi:hypothetical protein